MSETATAKRGEVRLAPAEESWDALPIGLCVVNERVQVLEINSAMTRMFGTRFPIATPVLLGALDTEFAKSVGAMITRVMRSGRLEENIEAVLRRQGEVRHLLVTIFPLEHGGATTAGLAVRDVTDWNQYSHMEAPASSSELVRRLAGGIAHDFNNLLTVVMANAALIRDAPYETRTTAHFAREIIRASERAAELTRQMLAFSGCAPVYKSVFQVNDLILELEPNLRCCVPERVELRLYLHDLLPAIRADEAQIRDIVNILFRNAVEAMEAEGGGHIDVETFSAAPGSSAYRRHGACVGLRVRDDGCGIAPEVLPRIFDPFYSTKFPGRGLGLAAAKGLASAHAGTIHVESAPGAGTVATVLLPLWMPPV